MSRLKIWGFAALVVVIGLAGVWVFTQRAAPPAMEQVAATLRSGSLQFETGTRLLSRQVRDVATVAAGDPDLASGLAALEAVQSAAALLEVETGRAPLVGFARDGTVALRVGERQFQPGDALAQAILGPVVPPRHVRVGDALYAVAVVRTDRGGTLAFGLPIDPRWTERLQAATGADLTFLGANPVSTLPPADAAVVVNAATGSGGAVVDAGRLGPIPAASGLPGFPVLFLEAPAFRARALSLPGIDGPVAVLSAPVRPSLAPIAAFQQTMMAALLLLGLVGLGLGMAREPVVPSHVPRDLASAADRISRGDFDVRVPRMSGTFGTLASALSRAAETARLARIGQYAAAPAVSAHPPTPTLTLDVPLHAVPPDEVTPTPQDGWPGGPLTAAALVQAAQAARAAHPRTTQPIGVDGPATPPPGRATPPPTAEEAEAPWRGVYEEFLRVRSAQGEAVDGVTWDRFRDKLRKNSDLLAQKYACRTVRFQVYVKEGKAALKATPVR